MREETTGRRITRRQLGRLATAAMAGAWITTTEAGKGQEKETSAQAVDTRLESIEKSRGRPLTDKQRKAVLQNLNNLEEAWEKNRAFVVPDGTEPNFIFRPAPVKRTRG